jgi:hypothetical protein
MADQYFNGDPRFKWRLGKRARCDFVTPPARAFSNLNKRCCTGERLLQMDWYASFPTCKYVLTTMLSRSLEINLHQLILSDLARNVGQSKFPEDLPSVEEAVELVSSKVETMNLPSQTEEPPRVFMVRKHTLRDKRPLLNRIYSRPRVCIAILHSASLLSTCQKHVLTQPSLG